MQAVLLVALGGAVGSVLRYETGALVLRQVGVAQFPWGTFTVNVLGCAIAGTLAGLAERHAFLTAEMRLLLFTGFLGGFTTFSAFANETVAVWRSGAGAVAAVNVAVSVFVCIAAVVVGRGLVAAVLK